MITFTTDAGAVFKFDLERQARTAYREYMNPATKYEKVYFQVNVYNEAGKKINFGFVDDENDAGAVIEAVKGVIDWYNTLDEVLAKMHNRYD